MLNLSLTADSDRLPHTAELAAINDEIQQLKDWIYDLERKRTRLRQEQQHAEAHAKGWFYLDEYAAQYFGGDTYLADKHLDRERRAGHTEHMGIAVWRFIPQRSTTEWNADLPFGISE